MDITALTPEKPSRILEVIRNPMIFNAFVVLVILVLAIRITMFDPSPNQIIMLAFAYAFIVGVTFWLNWFASKNPRFLAYGPKEYIRESELAHQRKLAGKE